MSYNTRIKLKSDTEANWLAADPILLDGEIAIVKFDDDTTKKKIGDGIKRFSELRYDEPKSLGITSASVGQIPKVKAVDSNGTPTEWEAATPSTTTTPMKKLTFTGGATGEYDGSSAVSIEIPNGAGSVQSDWNQNDSTASDYVKNRPGGYDKQVSINVDKDITADTEGVVVASDTAYYILLPEIESVYELVGAKIGTSLDDAKSVSSVEDGSAALPESYYNEGLRAYTLVSESAGNDQYYVYYFPKEMSIDNITFNKGYYILATLSHLYIYNNSIVSIPIDNRYINIGSISDEIKTVGSSIRFNCRWGQGINTYINSSGEKVISAPYKTYKAGNGISISTDGTISVTTATYYSGTSTPANTLGADGDLYLQTEG